MAPRWGWPLVLAWLLVLGACRAQPSQGDGTPTPAPDATRAATPTSQPAQPTSTPQANISIAAPAPGSHITSPVQVRGQARVFEAAVTIIVYDAQGQELARTSTQASLGAPGWGTYEQDVAFAAPDHQQEGRIEVVSYSPRDGNVLDRATVPVTLLPASGTARATPTATSPQR